MANEKRLIDANALMEHTKGLPTWFADGAGMFSCIEGYPKGLFYPEDIISSIENAPTVDAVAVVRCKNCKNWRENWIAGIESGVCLCGKPRRTKPDDFCSYGERRCRE